MTTVNLEQIFYDADNDIEDLYIQSNDSIDIVTPLPLTLTITTKTEANLVSDPAFLTTSSQSNLYNTLYNNPKADDIHSYLSSQNADDEFTGNVLGFGTQSSQIIAPNQNFTTIPVTASWPLLSNSRIDQNIFDTPNDDSFSNKGVAITEESALDVDLFTYRKGISNENLPFRNGKEKLAEAKSPNTNDNANIRKGAEEAKEENVITTNTSCDFNLIRTQDSLNYLPNRTKGRSLLHRLASFAAAASNSPNSTTSSPNRQLEKLTKRSLRLGSSRLKQSSLLMELLKINSIAEEEQQQHVYNQLACKEKSKTSGLSTSFHMLASQLLYSQLQVQKPSPMLILDYTLSNNSKESSSTKNQTDFEDCDQKEEERNGHHDKIIITSTPNENENIDIKTEEIPLNEAYLKLQSVSPAVSTVTNSSSTYDGTNKILNFWHEKLRALTQAHNCLKQFLKINQEMRNIFEAPLLQKQSDKQIFSNLREEKDIIESLLPKLHFVFRHCEDSRQLHLKINTEQTRLASTFFSNAQSPKDRYTPDLKPITETKESEPVEQEKFVIKMETSDTNDKMEAETKSNIFRNVWQPFANDTQRKISKEEKHIKENEKQPIQGDELYTDQTKIKPPVCFWHPKNLGLNRNEKAVTAVEIILECAALKNMDQNIAAPALNMPNNCNSKILENKIFSNLSQLTVPQIPPTLNSCNSPFLQVTSASSSSSNASLCSNYQDEAPTLNMLMADCGTSSFLTALSNRTLINLVSSTSTISTNIPPITTINPSCNRRKIKKQETNSPSTSHTSLNTTSSSCAASPPIPNNHIYGTHPSMAAAAVAALQEKALNNILKARFSALTAAAVINAATANAASNVDTTNASNSIPITNATLTTEGPYDLSIGSKFKKM